MESTPPSHKNRRQSALQRSLELMRKTSEAGGIKSFFKPSTEQCTRYITPKPKRKPFITVTLPPQPRQGRTAVSDCDENSDYIGNDNDEDAGDDHEEDSQGTVTDEEDEVDSLVDFSTENIGGCGDKLIQIDLVERQVRGGIFSLLQQVNVASVDGKKASLEASLLFNVWTQIKTTLFISSLEKLVSCLTKASLEEQGSVSSAPNLGETS